MEPLRIGVLGAARISGVAIVDPAHLTGARLVAVAARDRGRAQAFADEHGVEQAVGSYAELLALPEVEAVYNPLPNGLHGPWNLAAIAAGKHVLSEKPFASDAVEAAQVRDAGRAARVVVAEAFHYRYHPLMLHVLDLVGSGAIGDVTDIHAVMEIPAPPASDPRWSYELAGGALMDVGCYALHVQRTLGEFAGGEPELVGARGAERAGAPGCDEWAHADLVFPSGATGTAHCSMGAPALTMSLEVTGTAGHLRAENFVLPQLDDRVILTHEDGTTKVEHMGLRTSYTYQLEAFAKAVRDGAALATDADDAVLTMRLLDSVYDQIGLGPRPRSLRV